MKAFVFSLQKSLDARAAREEAAELAFGKAQRGLREAEKEWRRLQHSVQRHAATSAQAGDRVTPSDLSLWALRMEDLRERLDAQGRLRTERERAVEIVREQLMQAMRDRKVMEQLKARELRRWMTETRRLERRHMDEIASTAFVRRRREAAAVDTL